MGILSLWPDYRGMSYSPNIFQEGNGRGRRLVIIRISICGLNIVTLIIAATFMSTLYFLQHLTHWGLMLSTIYNLTLPILYIPYRKQNTKHKTKIFLSKLGIIFFELIWNLQFLITVIFWLILLPAVTLFGLESEDALEMTTIWVYIFLLYAHSGPFIGCLLDIYYNIALFVPKHVAFTLTLLALFAIVDIICTYTFGTSAYVILTWRHWIAVFVIFGLILTCILGFWLGWWISQRKYKKRIVDCATQPRGQTVEGSDIPHQDASLSIVDIQ